MFVLLTSLQGQMWGTRGMLSSLGAVPPCSANASRQHRVRLYLLTVARLVSVHINRGSAGPRTCSADITNVWLHTVVVRGETSKTPSQNNAQGDDDLFGLEKKVSSPLFAE